MSISVSIKQNEVFSTPAHLELALLHPLRSWLAFVLENVLGFGVSAPFPVLVTVIRLVHAERDHSVHFHR